LLVNLAEPKMCTYNKYSWCTEERKITSLMLHLKLMSKELLLWNREENVQTFSQGKPIAFWTFKPRT
jgi:hypothetical protein